MRWLDLREAWLVVVLAAAACSDDGVPQTDTQGSSSGGGGSSGGDTGTPSTTMTTGSPTDGSSSGTDPSVTATHGESSGSSGGSGTDSSSSGSSGSTASSDATGSDSSTGEPAGECMDASDCQLVEDCCNCVVIPVGEMPPPCGIMECFATACAPLGGDAAAACELGSCELAPVPCNPLELADECEEPPPCPDGSLPSIDTDTGCWSGLCVPAEACDVVPTCADCPDDEACVELYTHFGPVASCSPVDPSCGGAASCACMDALCTSPFDSCSETPDGLGCSCPVC